MHQYPELNDAILNFEKNFEEHLLANPVQPPAYIKIIFRKRIVWRIQLQKKLLDEHITPRVFIICNAWRYIAAACIILLIVSTALNFYFYSGYKNSKQQYEALLTERNTLQANNASYKQSLQMFEDTSMMHIEMKGMPGKEQNLATVLWDKNSKDVYIYTNEYAANTYR